MYKYITWNSIINNNDNSNNDNPTPIIYMGRSKIYQLFIIQQNLLLSNWYVFKFTISNYEVSHASSCAQVNRVGEHLLYYSIGRCSHWLFQLASNIETDNF